MSIEYHLCQECFEVPAIKLLALSRLKTAVDNYLVSNQKQQASSISLSYRANECGEVVYVSNVAFVFSKVVSNPPLEIARDFANVYSQVHPHKQDFIITVEPPGFLQLKLTELKLAQWLQCLQFLPLSLADFPSPEYSNLLENNSGLFAIQYAHARCYSLMQLAQSEGLITLEEISANKFQSQNIGLNTAPQDFSILVVNHPQPLPWLHYRQQRQFGHSAEDKLIIELIKVVDDFYSSTGLNLDYWVKVALNLSQAFAGFYSHCRIFGQTNPQIASLVSARLSLVFATYVVLKLLLQRLGVFAPRSL